MLERIMQIVTLVIMMLMILPAIFLIAAALAGIGHVAEMFLLWFTTTLPRVFL